jgi:hypothetical protein
MANYRILPKRGTYHVEQLDPQGQYQVVGTWRTEEDALSHLKKLEAEAQRADYKPAHGEIGWPPPPRR